jgi:hypothetical protein
VSSNLLVSGSTPFQTTGYFYDEDAYIAFKTFRACSSSPDYWRVFGPDQTSKMANSGKVLFSYGIYYWIDQQALQDDTATAANKSVELDECEFSTAIINLKAIKAVM